MATYSDEMKTSYEDNQAVKDVESSSVLDPGDGSSQMHTALKRQLKARHIAMISIGGVIGTGLFLGTASALENGGPVGLILGYAAMGSICYGVMISLGEMISYLPIPGGHIKLAERFVDPALSFTMGWNYWYSWILTMPAELSAASVLIDYWDKNLNLNSLWIAICIIVIVVINFLGAGAYGESEFIFASIKVITITGLIILGIVLDLGGGPNHDRIGFRYWKNPGPFVQYAGIAGSKGRFLGWWAVMTQAAFAYTGTEICAIAAGEAKNPRKSLPKAIKRVYIRILLFYIVGTAIIGLLVPSNNPSLNLQDGTAASSPFVIAIQNAGIKGLPHVINAALVTSAWSAGSSDLYASSRAIYGLALVGNAPKLFAKTNRNGLPYVAIAFCAVFSLLAYMGVKQNSTAGEVFIWFQNLTAICGLMTWFGICITYLRFYYGWKRQGLDRSSLPYRSWAQPFAAWWALIGCFVVCFFSGFSVFLTGGWNSATFVTNYLPFMLFPVLYIGASLYFRQMPKRTDEMDFISGIKEIENASYDTPPPRNWMERFWLWLL